MKILLDNRTFVSRLRGYIKLFLPFALQTHVMRKTYGIEEVLTIQNKLFKKLALLLPYGIVRRFLVCEERALIESKKIVLARHKFGEKKLGVVYTCITGGYEGLIPQSCVDDRYDYVCFTDSEKLLNEKTYNGWEIRPLMFSALDNVRNARWHKTHPHILLPEYDHSIWIDGNILIKGSHLYDRVDALIAEGVELAIPRHPQRNDIYEEAKSVIEQGKDNKEIVDRQISEYRSIGFPENTSLHETNIIFRKHSQVIALMEEWWSWIERYSRRDQLSFDFVLWRHKYRMTDFCGSDGIWGNPNQYRVIGFTSHGSKRG